jgi:hypothetical protein
LRKAAKHDAVRWYAGFDFGFDERVEVIAGLEDTRFVFSILDIVEIGLEEKSALDMVLTCWFEKG